METQKQEKIFHRGNHPVVICDLEIHVCPSCGQESIPLNSARMIERILQGKAKPSGQFTAELYEASSAI